MKRVMPLKSSVIPPILHHAAGEPDTASFDGDALTREHAIAIFPPERDAAAMPISC